MCACGLTSQFIEQEGAAVVQFERVDDEGVAQLLDLADKARTALLRAGLPVSLTSDNSDAPGALIEVDEGADEAGGVFITWSLSPEFTAEVSGFLLSGEITHPSIQLSGEIKAAMIDSILKMLNSSGLSAALSDDDMRPLSVVVS